MSEVPLYFQLMKKGSNQRSLLEKPQIPVGTRI